MPAISWRAWAGTNFVVVGDGWNQDKEQAAEFAKRLVGAMVAPMTFKDQEIVATASIGLAIGPN